MPQQAWSDKRERQYEHIKAGLEERGDSEDLAEEIAARTVNKERAGPARRRRRAAARPTTSPRRAVADCARTRPGRPDARPAVQRGPPARDQGPLEDEQGTARASPLAGSMRPADVHLPRAGARRLRSRRRRRHRRLRRRPRRRLALPLAAAHRRARFEPRLRRRSTTPRSTRPAAVAAALERVAAAARERGLGVLVDIVPNHVGVATPASARGGGTCCATGRRRSTPQAFDIDWAAGGGKLRFPCSVTRPTRICVSRTASCATTTTASRSPRERRRRRGAAGRGPPPPALRAGRWRRADHELNYRRFFAINTLAGLRVELPDVFDASHREIVSWVDDGLVDGLRVDHPDGLADPGRLPRSPRRGHRRACRCGWRRSSRATSRCRRTGRRPAPRATTRWRRSTGCSSTRGRGPRSGSTPSRGTDTRSTTPSAPSPTGCSAARSAAWSRDLAMGRRDPAGRRRGRRTARLLPRLPLVPAARAVAPRRGRGRGAGAGGPTWPRRST